MATKASKNRKTMEKFMVSKERSKTETSGESRSKEDRARKEMINDKEKTWEDNGKNDVEICKRDREVESNAKRREKGMEGRKKDGRRRENN